jgi:hypothetical protein
MKSAVKRNGPELKRKRKKVAPLGNSSILLVNEQSGFSLGIWNPSAESGEGIRWRPWPCPACGGGRSPLRHIRRSIEAGAALPENLDHPEQVAESQAGVLLEWTENCPHTVWKSEAFPKLAEGSEHVVYFDANGACVWKLTRPAVFGDSYYLVNELVHQRNNSPQEYLMRLRLWKTIFESAPKPIGITAAGQIVSIQQFISGSAPPQEAADTFLMEAGLTPRKQRLWLWKRTFPRFEIWVGDARSDNFVESPQGIVPIDLRLWITTPERPYFSPDV